MNVKPPLTYHIRQMCPEDIARVAKLEKRVFSDPWPEHAYVQELYFNPSARYFVLQVQETKGLNTWLPWKQPPQGKILGFAGVRVESGRGHISTLAVHPAWQGRGFGELLLITVLEAALALEAERVTLEVRVSNNVARSLYRKYAFRKTTLLRAYYKNGEDAALMESDVSADDYEQWLQQRRKAVEARLRRNVLRE